MAPVNLGTCNITPKSTVLTTIFGAIVATGAFGPNGGASSAGSAGSAGSAQFCQFCSNICSNLAGLARVQHGHDRSTRPLDRPAGV